MWPKMVRKEAPYENGIPSEIMLMMEVQQCSSVPYGERGEEKHTCSVCSSTFSSLAGLHTHRERHGGMYRCKACRRHFCNHYDYRQHQHMQQHWSCHSCSRVFDDEAKLQRHRGHGANTVTTFTCSRCYRSYCSSKALQQHNDACTDPTHTFPTPTHTGKDQHRWSSLHCNTCDLLFPSTATLKRHQSSNKEQCTTCLRSFCSVDQKRHHHCPGLFHYCHFCSRPFTSIKSWGQHMRAKHESVAKLFLCCSYCKTWFNTPQELRHHHKATKESPTWSCPVCYYDFSSRLSLLVHGVYSGHEENRCAICFDACQDALGLLPCFHLFHTDCITSWLQENETCPICRTMTRITYLNTV